jgi:hypothetical protein
MSMNSSRSQSRAHSNFRSTVSFGPKNSANRQPSLFDNCESIVPGSLNDASIIRAALVEAIRNCGKSREQLADQMSTLTGTEVTVRRINAFTAESREDYRFPSELARAFCIATGDFSLLQRQAELAGFHLINETDYSLLKLGREYLKQKRANENVEMIERSLAGVEL